MITRLSIRASSCLPIHTSIPLYLQPCAPMHSVTRRSRCSILQYLQARPYSIPPPPPPTTQTRPIDLRSQFSSPEVAPRIATQPTPKRSLRPYIYAVLFLGLGLLSGQYVRLVLAPPPLPPAGSKEDDSMIAFLTKQASKLPIVQQLSTDPAWTSHDAYSSLSEPERIPRLTTGPLAGARALGGYQRVFVNTETNEVVTVVWFGGVLAGWPGVTHGGLSATVMDESLGRCAIRQFPSKSGVTANLEITYLKPVVTNSFYVIRTMPEEGKTERKCWVNGTLETIDGKVCLKGRALFVVPKGYNTKAMNDKF